MRRNVPLFSAIYVGTRVTEMRVPFVLEVRDLWPDSIVAVGAINRNWLIRVLEKLEKYLYLHSTHIVTLTNCFKRIIVEKGVDENKITVLQNAADRETFLKDLDPGKLAEIRRRYGLEGKFVASYIGTLGMAHRADILIEAASRVTTPGSSSWRLGRVQSATKLRKDKVN